MTVNSIPAWSAWINDELVGFTSKETLIRYIRSRHGAQLDAGSIRITNCNENTVQVVSTQTGVILMTAQRAPVYARVI